MVSGSGSGLVAQGLFNFGLADVKSEGDLVAGHAINFIHFANGEFHWFRISGSGFGVHSLSQPTTSRSPKDHAGAGRV